MKVLVLQVWLFTLTLGLSAQDYIIQTKHYGIAEGLAHRSVRCTVQDKKGFIWVGGDGAGISRFDGYTFTHYNKANNNLSNDNITDILEAPDGMLWLFCDNDPAHRTMDVFNPVTGKAQPFKEYFKATLPAGFSQKFSGYAIDSSGTIYLGCVSPRGVAIYNPQSGFSFRPVDGPGAVTAKFLAGNKLLFIWISDAGDSAYSSSIIDKNTWKFVEQTKGCRYQPTYSQRGTGYTGICYGPGKAYALVSSPRVAAKDVIPLLEKYKIDANAICTFLDSAQNLLLADSLIFDLKTGKPLLNIRDVIPSYTTSWTVTNWLIDRTGTLWLGSAFGLTHISIIHNKFKQLLFNGRAAEKGISVRGLLPLPDGSLLVNTENTAQYHVFPLTGQAPYFVNPNQSPILTYGWGNDPNGNIYYFNKGETALLQQSPNGIIKKLNWLEHPLWCIYFIDANRFWAGSVFRHGIHAGNIGVDSVITDFNYNGFNELKKAGVYYIHPSRNGNIWVCAETGFYKANADKGILERYCTTGKGKFKLPVDNVLYYYEDKNGTFWLATVDKGLIKWNADTGNSICYGLQAGLPCETVYCIYEDSHGELWLSSEKGILQFNEKAGHITHIYNTGEGITNNEFNRIAHCRAADGTLYFGGFNGITAFNPDSFYNISATQAAALVLVNVAKYDGAQSGMADITAQYLSGSVIKLQPNDRFLMLDVALLSYNNTDAIKYGYRFDNDSVWIYQTTQRIQFGGMPYGNHFIHIKALSANGVSGTNELNINVIQLKPFYLRAWFLSLILFVLTTGAVLYTRYRTQRLRKRQKEIEQQVKIATAHIAEQANEIQHLSNLKTRFFTNVSHELRTPLTLIKGPLSKLLKNNTLNEDARKQTETADYHARQLLQLTNELLDLSKLDAGKMTLNETPLSLQPFMAQVVAGFESHAESLDIKLQLHYNAAKRLHILADTNKLAKIINNLLSNALKFTPAAGQINLTVNETESLIVIEVADTGKGIHAEDLPFVFDRFYQTSRKDAPYEGGTGIGLTMCRDYTQLMGGKIEVVSQLGKGSTFTVTILKKEATGIFYENLRSKANDDITGNIIVEQPSTIKHTVLIVEDNPAMRSYIEQLLQLHYYVITAENGSQALDILKNTEQQPNLILSDVMMPVMDGFELLGILKGNEQLRHIPVVMLTARAGMEDKLRALRIGVDDYLLKPFEEQELKARIHNLLNNFIARVKPIENELASAGEDVTPVSEINTGERALISNEEQTWLTNLEHLVSGRVADPALSVEVLAKDLAMSRSTFLRQLKRLTGLTPTQYIDEMRFANARMLLENKDVNSVKAAALSVGFLQVEHFSRSFYKRFGKYPSAYLL